MASGKNDRWFKVAPAFILAMLILVLIGVLSYKSTSQLQETSAWVAHTQEVIGELQEVVSSLKDIQLGSKGYLLLGKKNYLEPYEQGLKEVYAHLSRVKKLTLDNAEEKKNYQS